jgi:NTE family protein
MGKVVKLDAPAAKRRQAGATTRPRTRKRRSRTALVLGGGGFTGGVYEIGALRALDLLSTNRTVNEFDVYVGTSAGSFVAALIANGVTPEEMMRVVNQQSGASFADMDSGTLLRPNLVEFARKGAELPFRAAGLLRRLAGQLGETSVMDLVLALAQWLPSGLYSGHGIEEYMQGVLSVPGRTDDFRALAADLFLVATDLDSCERIVFGTEGFDDVPISTAVRASTALPMVYKPVRVGDRDLIDGGVISTTNIDIAVEAGAKLIIVVNPLVPYINDFTERVPTVSGSRARRVSDMGFPQIGYQTFKLLAHQRLHERRSHWKHDYPGVDFILIEPEPNDELMFETSIMDFASRVDIARHGFQSVTVKLASEYDDLRAVCARHGLELSPTRLRKVIKHFSAEKETARAWRKILEQTTGALLRQSAAEDTGS